jgi:serine/threonine protein kinase
MTWISDDAVARLRVVADSVDFNDARYGIVRELGRGGMGVVYEADDNALQRRIAIKVLATELSSREAAERMRREAHVIAALDHPGIVPLYDIGELADGRIFYTMKLVRGRTLDAHDNLRAFLRVCEAAAFAHARGVVHCDLKPSNVMIGEFGEVLVMDWGVARAVGERAPAGTRGFMSPEQERGEPIDAATDVYALGVMLRDVSTQPMPRRMAAICDRATANDARLRYANAGELAADLTRFIDGEPVLAHRENLFERAVRWLDRNRALIAVIAAYVIMRAIVLLISHR